MAEQFKVQIVNARSMRGWSEYVGLKRAQKLVKSRRAVVVQDHQGLMVAIAVKYPRGAPPAPAPHRSRESELAYDRIRRPLTREELSGLPMVGDINKAMQVFTPPDPNWSYRAGGGRFSRRGHSVRSGV